MPVIILRMLFPVPDHTSYQHRHHTHHDPGQNPHCISSHNAYRKNNPKITHFYNSAGYAEVPLWALFEIMTMGDFGNLLSCLTYNVRDDISKRLGLNTSPDTNRELIYKYVYTLKDLRNAIAHNAVIFDTRFRNIDPTHAMKQCLILDIGLPYVNFNIFPFKMSIIFKLNLLIIALEHRLRISSG